MTTGDSHLARWDELRAASNSALERMHAARELGFQASRKAIQLSSQAIRAAHRGEFEGARALCDAAGRVLAAADVEIADHPLIRYSGFISDGQKEYSEAVLVVAFLSGTRVPSAQEINVPWPPYLNGLAEAASELRRSALDAIRKGDVNRADHLLRTMDEAMGLLETMDFPEAVTGGLRRTTDGLRAVIERTRGDVVAALRQQALEARLRAVEAISSQAV